jgi:hypothetical protein
MQTMIKQWIAEATRNINAADAERISSELEQHYADAVQAHALKGTPYPNIHALNDLGDAKQANLQFLRLYLTQREAKLLPEIQKMSRWNNYFIWMSVAFAVMVLLSVLGVLPIPGLPDAPWVFAAWAASTLFQCAEPWVKAWFIQRLPTDTAIRVCVLLTVLFVASPIGIWLKSVLGWFQQEYRVDMMAFLGFMALIGLVDLGAIYAKLLRRARA